MLLFARRSCSSIQEMAVRCDKIGAHSRGNYGKGCNTMCGSLLGHTPVLGNCSCMSRTEELTSSTLETITLWRSCWRGSFAVRTMWGMELDTLAILRPAARNDFDRRQHIEEVSNGVEIIRRWTRIIILLAELLSQRETDDQLARSNNSVWLI